MSKKYFLFLIGLILTVIMVVYETPFLQAPSVTPINNDLWLTDLTNSTYYQIIINETCNMTCNFITFNYIGRTGNLMFQYASFYAIAKFNGKIPFIFHQLHYTYNSLYEKHFSLGNVFQISIPVLNTAPSVYHKRHFENLKEKKAYFYDNETEHLNLASNYNLIGYRCSWKYFDKYSNDIKKEFQFKEDIRNQYEKSLNDFVLENNITRANCLLIGK